MSLYKAANFDVEYRLESFKMSDDILHVMKNEKGKIAFIYDENNAML
jgi:hypothetical protein